MKDISRIVRISFWTDPLVVDNFSPEDKLFYLYLLTNPHTTQLGIYQINKKHMAFELGYSIETINVLIDRFENKYKTIIYDNETKEIAILNYLKHSIIKGGTPVENCLTMEIKKVKSEKLKLAVYNNLKASKDLNKSVEKVIKLLINDIENENDNDNDNENERYANESIYDSQNNKINKKENNNFDDFTQSDDYKRFMENYNKKKKQYEKLEEPTWIKKGDY